MDVCLSVYAPFVGHEAKKLAPAIECLVSRGFLALKIPKKHGNIIQT